MSEMEDPDNVYDPTAPLDAFKCSECSRYFLNWPAFETHNQDKICISVTEKDDDETFFSSDDDDHSFKGFDPYEEDPMSSKPCPKSKKKTKSRQEEIKFRVVKIGPNLVFYTCITCNVSYLNRDDLDQHPCTNRFVRRRRHPIESCQDQSVNDDETTSEMIPDHPDLRKTTRRASERIKKMRNSRFNSSSSMTSESRELFSRTILDTDESGLIRVEKTLRQSWIGTSKNGIRRTRKKGNRK